MFSATRAFIPNCMQQSHSLPTAIQLLFQTILLHWWWEILRGFYSSQDVVCSCREWAPGIGTWLSDLQLCLPMLEAEGFCCWEDPVDFAPRVFEPQLLLHTCWGPTYPITSISHLLASTLITELRSQIFKKSLLIYLIRMVFGLHVCLCEGVESIGIRVTDSC